MSDRPAVRRLWIPLAVWLLAAGAIVAAPYIENEDFGRQQGVLVAYAAVSLALLVTVLWLLFLSGLRWFVRLGILVAAVGLFVGTVNGFDNQGDMIPRPKWRWQKTASEVVAADRVTRAKATAGQPMPTPTPEDFPEYRNPKRDGVVVGPPLARDWKANPPKELWRLPCGEGYAGISVVGNVAVTIDQRGTDEAVVCYDADTGRERWDFRYPANFREQLGGDGPRTNPTIVDGDVYAFGATGVLVRLDGATGQLKWRVDVLKDNGNVEWGMAGSPLVYDRVVVVNGGTQSEKSANRALIAYDRDTGKEVWAAGTRKAGYASPMLATLCGVRQILTFDAAAVAGFDAATGKELWSFAMEHVNDPGINVGQPLALDGDRVFVSAAYGKGCAMIQVTKTDAGFAAKSVYTGNQMKCKFTSPVFKDGCIYGLDDGILACIDAATGQRKWKDGRYGHGQILLAGDLIVVGSETGKLVLVEASPTAFKEVASIQALPGPKNWNHFALARGRAYLRNHHEMACYDLPRGG